MNSYLFTGWTVRTATQRVRGGARGDYDILNSVDACSSTIVCADNFETAQSQFEKWLSSSSDPAQPVFVKIRKIFAAPMMEYLFTESGPQPLNCLKISEEIATASDSIPVDDFEQGYWLDVNEAVRSSSSIDALRETLPEDVRSGLNWSADKQFIFLLTVFTPPAPPAEPLDEAEMESSKTEPTEEENSEPTPSELSEQQATFPQLAEKEVAAIIRARNSAVAALLWRNYAATTPLATNTIRIDPPCGIVYPSENEAKTDEAQAT